MSYSEQDIHIRPFLRVKVPIVLSEACIVLSILKAFYLSGLVNVVFFEIFHETEYFSGLPFLSPCTVGKLEKMVVKSYGFSFVFFCRLGHPDCTSRTYHAFDLIVTERSYEMIDLRKNLEIHECIFYSKIYKNWQSLGLK